MRRDLDLDCEPAELVLQPPDRSQLREMFRQFEFRGLLSRVDQLDEAVPARPMRVEGTEVAWREGDFPQLRGRASLAIVDDRFALAQDDVVVGTWKPETAGRIPDDVLVAHDFKALPRLTMRPAEDTMILAYLIEPGRAAYELDDLAREYGCVRGNLLVGEPRSRGGLRRSCWTAFANAAASTCIARSSCR